MVTDLKKKKKKICTTSDSLEFKTAMNGYFKKGITKKTVAVYMSIPWSGNLTFGDESQPESGCWVYIVEDIPGEDIWEWTDNVEVQYINRK